MATLTTSVAFNMDDWNLGDIGDGRLGAHNAHDFTVRGDAGRTYNFGGHNFDYFGIGGFAVPTGGEVQSLTIADSGHTVFSLTGISIDVPALEGFLVANQFDALETYLFRGDDHITGSKFADVLRGFTGDDVLSGGKGADSLEGGLGADTLTGGKGADTFVFASALDSTGVAFDHIGDFDASLDSFVFDHAVNAVDTAIVGGRLSARHFDGDLADATDNGALGGHDAVLFSPDAGKHAGETFLIVDLNGDAGYQFGEDAVIQFGSGSHLAGLDAGNFATG